MTTIKDVAKKAGVAVSTVSYALSGTRPIGEDTRQRILQAIEELNYHPNHLARSMINKRTRIIALLFPAATMSTREDLPVEFEFIISVATAAYEHDYGLLLFTHPIDEDEIMRFIHQGLVDGVILMEVLRDDPRVQLMKQSGYPFSLIGRCENNDGISFVDVDFYKGYSLAVEHLAALKHQSIAFIKPVHDPDKNQLNYVAESTRGFQETALRLGVEGIICHCEPTFESGYETMKHLLETNSEITGAIVGNDLVYSGVYQALQEKGVNVPNDFSLIGSISSRSAEKHTPKVTTISVPSFQMGALGTQFLVKQLENPQPEPQQVLLPPEFVIRQSTAMRHERSK